MGKRAGTLNRFIGSNASDRRTKRVDVLSIGCLGLLLSVAPLGCGDDPATSPGGSGSGTTSGGRAPGSGGAASAGAPSTSFSGGTSSSSGGAIVTGGSATGGASASGGSLASGGSVVSGGTAGSSTSSPTAGSSVQGGGAGKGGSASGGTLQATGGATSGMAGGIGGSSSRGGAGGKGGGTSAAGGSKATGGTSSGGNANGGSVGSGGKSSGGSTATGGTGTGGIASGGTTSVGGGKCPATLTCPSGMICGCYVVPGLGNNKKALLDAGANQEMLASAMMETEMMDTNYAYGDNKTGDSFNAGTTKQNWGMMRTCHAAWNGLAASSFATSAALNTNRALDVQVYMECRAHYGDLWWAGHRNGSTGISNPNTQDIRNFRAAWDWTNSVLTGHTTDDVRFWVDVPAILIE